MPLCKENPLLTLDLSFLSSPWDIFGPSIAILSTTVLLQTGINLSKAFPYEFAVIRRKAYALLESTTNDSTGIYM